MTLRFSQQQILVLGVVLLTMAISLSYANYRHAVDSYEEARLRYESVIKEQQAVEQHRRHIATTARHITPPEQVQKEIAALNIAHASWHLSANVGISQKPRSGTSPFIIRDIQLTAGQLELTELGLLLKELHRAFPTADFAELTLTPFEHTSDSATNYWTVTLLAREFEYVPPQ
jgi:hypothetical protein